MAVCKHLQHRLVHPKVTPAWGTGKKTTHASLTACLAMGKILPTNEMGGQKESALQDGATIALANAWSDSTQVQGSPNLTQGPNHATTGKEPLQTIGLKEKMAQLQ